MLFILFADQATLAARLLSTKLFVGIGLLSYSIYLWHQSIFSFFRIYTNQISLNWFVALVLILITFLLSFLTWKFIEKIFRNRNFMSRSSLFYLSLSMLAVLLTLGYISKKVTVEAAYELAGQLSENDFVYFENLDERKFMEGRLLYPLNAVDTIVVGSSRVMQINSRMMGENIQSFTVSGASIEDNIAFALEALPKLNYRNIYISADPWLINLHDGQNRYQSVQELFDY